MSQGVEKEGVSAELQRHFSREEEARNQGVIEIARRLGLPLLATNEARHAVPEQRELLDVLTCVRKKTRLDSAGRLLARNSERYLKPAAVMSELFADQPEALANSVELSGRLDFTLADLGYEFPNYPVPAGETMISFLRQRTEEGVRGRYLSKKNPCLFEGARLQIERELNLIEKLQLEGYFLIVWDIVRFCNLQ